MSKQLTDNIIEASKVVGKTWPLYSFVTSNPLAGYEKSSFENAINEAAKYLGGSTLPNVNMFEQAWQNGEIEREVLLSILLNNGFHQHPEFYLQEMAQEKIQTRTNRTHQLDRMMCKWLSFYIDEGFAEWEMPYKREGFFYAWKALAKYDKELHKITLPKNKDEVFEVVLKPFSNQVSQQYVF